LRTRLIAVWVMLAVSALVTGFLLWQFYQQSANVQLSQAESTVVQACRDIGDRYAFYASGWSGRNAGLDERLKGDLQDVVKTALNRVEGVEGGIWNTAAGSLTYAFPTYEGTGPKTDVPSAELSAIQRINNEALRSGRPVTVRQSGQSHVLVMHACLLKGPIPDATAWTMTRVFIGRGAAYRQLLTGLAVLTFAVLGSAAWLAGILLAWSRKISRLESALAAREIGRAEFPALARTGERELDRLVDALNVTGAQLKDEGQRAASAERLAAVGRLAAGLAHEIRNPIAAMRLKAESALCVDEEIRLKSALRAILDQVGRLDALLRDLLTMTQQSQPKLVETDLWDLLGRVAETHAEFALSKGISLRVMAEGPRPMARLDASQIRRCLDNLVLNGIQNAPKGGVITISATHSNDRLYLRVSDDGPGIAAEIRDRLFEPFVTGRPDGTGLGLAIVREIARAHGGDARLVGSKEGAVFEIELPWQPS
jgi:signal transduction histidine kinase